MSGPDACEHASLLGGLPLSQGKGSWKAPCSLPETRSEGEKIGEPTQGNERLRKLSFFCNE